MLSRTKLMLARVPNTEFDPDLGDPAQRNHQLAIKDFGGQNDKDERCSTRQSQTVFHNPFCCVKEFLECNYKFLLA